MLPRLGVVLQRGLAPRLRSSVIRRCSSSIVSQHTFDSLGSFDDRPPLPSLDAAESAPTTKRESMYHGIKRHMAMYPESVILTQMGSFYELYYDQAVEFGPKLNLKIAKKGTSEEACGYVHMAGFPTYQLERYLKILVNDLRTTVTLVEQFELPEKQNGRQFERKVTRTVTPGTLITESFIDAQQSNFLVSIVFTNAHLEKDHPSDDSPVALAWLDLSVGEFCYQASTVKDLVSDIARLQPKEILLDSSIRKFAIEEGKWYQDLIELKRYYISYHRFPAKEMFDYYAPYANLKLEQYRADNTGQRELSALTAILAYIKENLPECEVQIKSPKEHYSRAIMKLDSRSIDALELFNSTTDSARGSLYSTIKRTASPSGSRMLSSWLSAPLVDISAINQRHDWVEFFMYHGALTRELADKLRYMDDVVRIMQRLSSLRRTDPADLVAVASAIRLMDKLRTILSSEQSPVTESLVQTMKQCLKRPLKLAAKVEKCIDQDAVIQREEDGEADGDDQPVQPKRQPRKSAFDGMDNSRIMKADATPALARLFEEYESFDDKKRALWEELRSKQPSGVQLSLKWSPMYLYHVHVTLPKKNVTFDDVQIPGLILNQTKSRQCIQFKEWTELGTRREGLNERKRELEDRLLKKLRKEALECLEDIRSCCEVADTLDVVTSFAVLAREHNLIRPEMTDETVSRVDSGRHITVETGLKTRGSPFTSNDCDLNGNKLWVITGPNMGGKSTFIRQTALISILAQVGSFVPVASAKLGIVDQIFCRVGAADDLYRDRSTFMVEMLETSSILRNATPRSLAILDEVGRGTSGKDGLAIAYATLVHLATVNKCRTLFATHFGPELWELLERNNKNDLVEYYQATWFDSKFHYKLQPGVSNNSHGLEVARMAGFPSEALKVAHSVYNKNE